MISCQPRLAVNLEIRADSDPDGSRTADLGQQWLAADPAERSKLVKRFFSGAAGKPVITAIDGWVELAAARLSPGAGQPPRFLATVYIALSRDEAAAVGVGVAFVDKSLLCSFSVCFNHQVQSDIEHGIDARLMAGDALHNSVVLKP